MGSETSHSDPGDHHQTSSKKNGFRAKNHGSKKTDGMLAGLCQGLGVWGIYGKMSLKIHLPCSKVMAEWNVRYTIHLLYTGIALHPPPYPCFTVHPRKKCQHHGKANKNGCKLMQRSLPCSSHDIWSPRDFRWSQGGCYHYPGTGAAHRGRPTAHHRRKERVSSGGAWSGAKYLRQTSEAVVNSARSWQTRSLGDPGVGSHGPGHPVNLNGSIDFSYQQEWELMHSVGLICVDNLTIVQIHIM